MEHYHKAASTTRDGDGAMLHPSHAASGAPVVRVVSHLKARAIASLARAAIV